MIKVIMIVVIITVIIKLNEFTEQSNHAWKKVPLNELNNYHA